MVTRLGERRVSFEECRFDEKNVSILREPNDLFDVRVRKGAIDHVGDLTTSGDFHDLLFENAKGNGRPANGACDRALAPHVDVCALFEGKCEHGIAVIKKRRTNLEAGLLEKKAFIALPRSALEALEPGRAGKRRRCEVTRQVGLRDVEDQFSFVSIEKIPAIRPASMRPVVP